MELWLADLVAGAVWLGVALLATVYRGSLTVFAGLVAAAWFTVDVLPGSVFWHRAIVVHAVLSGPGWWPRSWTARVAVAAGYVAAALVGPWASPIGAVGLAIVVLAGFAVERRGRDGPLAIAGCLTAVAAFTVPVLLGAMRTRQWSTPISWAYAAALTLVALLLYAQARVMAARSTLDVLVELGPSRVDDGSAEERALASRLRAAHARLQRELESVRDEVKASRQRLATSSARARAALRAELDERVQAPIAALICAPVPATGRAAAHVAAARRHLEAARDDIDMLARGLAPRALAGGLGVSLRELVRAAPLPVELSGAQTRVGTDAEHAVYFVCAEALTNVVKHAQATLVAITVTTDDALVRVEVTDNGAGGADARKGQGIIGMRDRVEALGGTLVIESSSTGTRVCALIPVEPVAVGFDEAAAVSS